MAEPETPEELKSRGNDEAESGDLVKAAESFRLATELAFAYGRPKRVRATLHELRAQCLLEMEDASPDSALEDAIKAVELAENWEEAHITLSHVLRNTGDLIGAQESLTKALDLMDKNEKYARKAETEKELKEVRELMRSASRRSEMSITAPRQSSHDTKRAPSRSLSLSRVLEDSLDEPAGGPFEVELPPSKGGHVLEINDAGSLKLGRGKAGGGGGDCGVCGAGGLGPGGKVWECGVALARGLVAGRFPVELHGQHVLELGAGTGVGGITAAALGAHVTLTDLPELVPLMMANAYAQNNAAAVSEAGGSINVAPLDWSKIDWENLGAMDPVTRKILFPLQPYAYVLASDLVYRDEALHTLTPVVRKALKGKCKDGKPCKLLWVHKSRSKALDTAVSAAFAVEGIKLWEIKSRGGDIPKNIQVYHGELIAW